MFKFKECHRIQFKSFVEIKLTEIYCVCEASVFIPPLFCVAPVQGGRPCWEPYTATKLQQMKPHKMFECQSWRFDLLLVNTHTNIKDAWEYVGSEETIGHFCT